MCITNETKAQPPFTSNKNFWEAWGLREFSFIVIQACSLIKTHKSHLYDISTEVCGGMERAYLDLLEEKLSRIKAERMEQYESLRLYSRCKAIAVNLGKTIPKKHGDWHLYRDEELEIWYDDYGPNIDVYYKGQRVLCFHLGDLVAFRPGEWLKKVIDLSEPLLKDEEEEAVRAKISQLEEELKKWEPVGEWRG